MFIKGMSFINYKKFKEATELELDDFTGRIGILGNNGSGKSSLLDVILIALYGVDAVSGKKEHLRTQGQDKDVVMLRLDFEHEKKHYIIERVFKGATLTPKASIFHVLDEVPHILATGAKEVTAYVEKQLNMDYSTFVATVFCKQKELDRIASMLPSERKSFILKLSRVDDIDNDIKKCRELKRETNRSVELLTSDVMAKESAKQNIATLNKDVALLRKEHSGILEKLAIYEKSFNSADEAKKIFDEKYEKYNELSLELKDCSNRLDSAKREFNGLSEKKTELERLAVFIKNGGAAKIDRLNCVADRLSELDSERPVYLEKKQLENSLSTIDRQKNESEKELASINETINRLGYTPDTLTSLEKELVEYDEKANILKGELLDLSSEGNSLKVKIKEFEEEIQKVEALYNGNEEADCKCPMCKQVVSKEYTEIVKRHYVGEVESHQILIQNVRNKYTSTNNSAKDVANSILSIKKNIQNERNREKEFEQLTARVNAVIRIHKEKLNEYNTIKSRLDEITGVVFDEAEYNGLKTEKNKLDSEAREVYIAMDKVTEIPAIESNIAECSKFIATLTTEYDNIVVRGKALNFNKEGYVGAKKIYDKAFLDLQGVKDEASVIMNEINSKDGAERKYLNKRLDDIKKKEVEFNKQRALYNDYTILEEALMSTKTEIMSKINPLINKHLSELFKTMMNDKYDDIELDENYNIMVYDCGEAYPLSRFSGGEQDLINLSLRLAISKFLTELNAGNIECVVLDEIFASLDDDKKSALIHVLGGLSDFFRQIFIISHEDVIKSSLDCYLTVKENADRCSEIEF